MRSKKGKGLISKDTLLSLSQVKLRKQTIHLYRVAYVFTNIYAMKQISIAVVLHQGLVSSLLIKTV